MYEEVRAPPSMDPAAIRVAEARALQSAKLANYQAEARQRWEKQAERRSEKRAAITPTDEARHFRAYRRFRADLQRPSVPSSLLPAVNTLPLSQLVQLDEGSTRRTRHDVGKERFFIYIKKNFLVLKMNNTMPKYT